MKADGIAEELLLRHGRSREAMRHWAARDATGASVIRVLARGTRPDLLHELVQLPVDNIGTLRSKKEFERWFERQLHTVAGTVRKGNRRNPRVQPGLKWGHGAKVLSIYVRSLVLHSRFFPDRVVNRVKPWPFVPVDGYSIKKLRSCGVNPPFGRIKDIATRRAFYFVQELLADSCGRRVARVVFDDSWADRGDIS